MYIARVTVEEFYNEATDGISRRGYNLTSIKIEPGNGHFGETPTAPVLQSGSIKNISQLFNFVNRFDKDFDPNPASKVINKDGTPKVMYRGDKEDISIFDRKKSRPSNLYGRGFYFTDSESHAGEYGEPKAYYLNIVDPLSPGQNSITREQMRSFLEAVADNEDDYDIWNYGTTDIDEVLESVWGKGDFEMLQDILLNRSTEWEAPDQKDHALFKEKGFRNYREKVRVDNVIFNTIVRVGRAKFGDIFYDINLEVDRYLPHTDNSASDILKRSTYDNRIPQKEFFVKSLGK